MGTEESPFDGSQLPLQSNGDSQKGGESGHPAKCIFRMCTIRAGLLAGAIIIVIVVPAIVLAVQKYQCPGDSTAASMWPDGWFRNRGKFYYFSKEERNWTSSQNFCYSHGASLTGIDDLLALDSLLPYKGKLDHWIGLRKDMGQVWKWANNTAFDHRFEIQGRADCAFLDGDLTVGSSSCLTTRKWICSKLVSPTKGSVKWKETHELKGSSDQTWHASFWSLSWPLPAVAWVLIFICLQDFVWS